MGNNFKFSVINRDSLKCPTLTKSYHKVNSGPFVETEYGLRLLRKHEAERLMGAHVDSEHYATVIQILGQGVQTRVFAEVLNQLRNFLDR